MPEIKETNNVTQDTSNVGGIPSRQNTANEDADSLGRRITAAERGDSDEMLSRGDMYFNGEGVEQDYAKAVEWYTKAAELGETNAMSNLGYMYANGEGVEQDKTAAVQWFTKAADLGHADAMFNLGVMYYNGDGVEQD